MASKKSSAKKTDVEDRTAALIRKAYKAGFKEGQNERNKRLNCLKITNKHLWKELCRLDRNEPSEGIWLSVSFAEKLAAALQKKHSGYARDLRKKIRNSNRKLSKLLKILEHHKEFK